MYEYCMSSYTVEGIAVTRLSPDTCHNILCIIKAKNRYYFFFRENVSNMAARSAYYII